MRLLIGTRPDVDVAVVKEAALVADRPVVTGPGLHDQVHRLPLAFVHAHGIAVGRQHLVGHATHETAIQPSLRQHVDHRHLLGDAHGLAAVGDRVAQDQQPRLAGQPRQRRQHQRCGRIDAGRGLMMLVEHDLDAFVLGDQPFVDVAIVERGALLRVVDAIGQGDADRFVFVGRRQIGIGVLAEVPRFHDRAPDFSLLAPGPSRNCWTIASVACGCSTWGRWPAAAMVSIRACGISAA